MARGRRARASKRQARLGPGKVAPGSTHCTDDRGRPLGAKAARRRARRTRFETAVAVGRRGAETPTGLFYVTAAFVPTERYLGAYAFETSAYSKLSEWPGGGVVGLHGTTVPRLLGKAVSHGCVRMSNAAVRVLRRLVDAGTPVRIVS